MHTASKSATQKIRPGAGNMASNRIHSMYSFYRFAPTGRTNYNTHPISMVDNDHKHILLLWTPDIQDAQCICFFHRLDSLQCLHTNHGLHLLFHSVNIHRKDPLLRKLHFLFHKWMLMVATFYKNMVALVESKRTIHLCYTY